jgi:hypothetical protein
MTSPNVIPLHPRNHRRSRVLDMHGATVTRLSEHRSLGSRYQDSCRQADVLNASIGELWLRAYLASINYALVIAGLHPQQDGASACKKIYPRQGKPSVNAEDQA